MPFFPSPLPCRTQTETNWGEHGAVFHQGRKASIAAAERIGGRILEVGVGTGISLPDYSRSNRLVGIDISEPMLRKALGRVRYF